MALISCPECKKEISDTAPNCPNCGYIFLNKQKDIIQQLNPTEIHNTKPNIGLGIFLIFIGVIVFIVGLLLVSIIIGIFPLIVGFALIVLGVDKIRSNREATCPHCGKIIRFSNTSLNVKCHICNKTSVKDGDYLKPIL